MNVTFTTLEKDSDEQFNSLQWLTLDASQCEIAMHTFWEIWFCFVLFWWLFKLRSPRMINTVYGSHFCCWLLAHQAFSQQLSLSLSLSLFSVYKTFARASNNNDNWHQSLKSIDVSRFSWVQLAFQILVFCFGFIVDGADEYSDQVQFSWQIWYFLSSTGVLLRRLVGIDFVPVGYSTVAARHFPLLKMPTNLKCTWPPKLQTQFAIVHRFAVCWL